jgi:hypothetical protein
MSEPELEPEIIETFTCPECGLDYHFKTECPDCGTHKE